MALCNPTHFLHAENKTLHSLLQKLNQLKQWNTWLEENIQDKSLVRHCHIVNLQGTSLIVIADSAHWVTRLRFYIPELLKKLKHYPGLEKIGGICCKTYPNPSPVFKKKPQPLQKLSAKTTDILLASAEKIQNKELREIMKRIALHKSS